MRLAVNDSQIWGLRLSLRSHPPALLSLSKRIFLNDQESVKRDGRKKVVTNNHKDQDNPCSLSLSSVLTRGGRGEAIIVEVTDGVHPSLRTPKVLLFLKQFYTMNITF